VVVLFVLACVRVPVIVVPVSLVGAVCSLSRPSVVGSVIKERRCVVDNPKLKSGLPVVPHSILYFCQVCGWVGSYEDLYLGEIGTKGYGEDPECPRCRSTDLRNDYYPKGGD
jgi:hypothetical protein